MASAQDLRKSILDPTGLAYDDWQDQWRRLNPGANLSPSPADGDLRGAWRPGPTDATALNSIQDLDTSSTEPSSATEAKPSVGHPGLAESLIPVWGSGREALADFQEGKFVDAGINAGLAASDFLVWGDLAKVISKGGIYIARDGKALPYVWKKMRARLGKEGYLEFGQHGHHWAIPQKGWGSKVPDFIKNQGLNIKPMPSAEVNGRITGGYLGKPRFNHLQRYWYGTPRWGKAAPVAAGGHAAADVWNANKKHPDLP